MTPAAEMLPGSERQRLSLSVIISTYNRASLLSRLLSSLQQLRPGNFEVVVVNGPSTDDTDLILQRWRDRIKIVRCPNRNISESRNLGLNAAAGDIVVFTDDDALPKDEWWLERYARAFADDVGGRIGCAGGPVWHMDTDRMEFNAGLTDEYGFQIFDVTKVAHLRVGRRWVSRAPGCNCAFRRAALVQVGGFDEFFTYYHDETDICLRLARAGFTTIDLPKNGVRHYSAALERRASKYDRDYAVIAQSDAYFALKNARAPLPLRLLRTLVALPRKHFFWEINVYLLHREIGVAQWLRLLARWALGTLRGLRAGMLTPRRIGRITPTPPALLPFAPPQ